MTREASPSDGTCVTKKISRLLNLPGLLLNYIYTKLNYPKELVPFSHLFCASEL